MNGAAADVDNDEQEDDDLSGEEEEEGDEDDEGRFQCGSGSRALMTQNVRFYSWEKLKFYKIKNCNLFIPEGLQE